MKKDKLYLFTFTSLLFIVYLVGYYSMNYLIDVNTEQLLEIQMESSKREAKEFSYMISSQLNNGIPEKDVINNIQKSIENTDNETGFICMFDWSGKEICHPNLERVGKYATPEESFISTINDDATSKDFYYYLKNKKEGGGIRTFSEESRESEIIYVYPVKNTDWIVAAHANTKKIKELISELKNKFIIVSQEFHNKRAVYIAEKFGCDVQALNARAVRSKFTSKREYLARVKIFVDLMVGKKPHFLGEKITIGKPQKDINA